MQQNVFLQPSMGGLTNKGEKFTKKMYRIQRQLKIKHIFYIQEVLTDVCPKRITVQNLITVYCWTSPNYFCTEVKTFRAKFQRLQTQGFFFCNQVCEQFFWRELGLNETIVLQILYHKKQLLHI
eukprot:TRINITY_DN18288_c0_g2_i3.p3 TRINITY_DN18288_c0_g2~~TRINITY_DN18288_c0_g2_i3.p3  ORF type:complete len:124 (-),score=0.59 TRINITY_DN18288_c0_g2_i3:146-517(-)